MGCRGGVLLPSTVSGLGLGFRGLGLRFWGVGLGRFWVKTSRRRNTGAQRSTFMYVCTYVCM